MKKQTKYPCTLYYKDYSVGKKASDYSRREIVEGNIVKDTLSVKAVHPDDRFNWFAVEDSSRLVALGPRVFWKQMNKTSLTCKEGKLYGSMNPILLTAILEAFHIDWAKPKYVRNCLVQRKDLWQDVISGKITNPEMLLKKISKKYFKGVYSYKALKEYFESFVASYHSRGLNLWNLYYYTTNPDLTLRKIMSAEGEEYRDILRDCIKYCNLFGDQVLNTNWSIKRLEEEHRLQIRRDMIENPPKDLSETNICTPYEDNGLSLFLNEKEAYIEATYMSNCTWRCYWPQMCRGEYLLIKGKMNNQYVHLGLYAKREQGIGLVLTWDQLHRRDNHDIRPETEKMVHTWFDNNYTSLLDKVREIRKNNLLLSLNNIENENNIPW